MMILLQLKRITVSQDVQTDFLCSWPSLNSYLKLDVDPRRDDDASPMSSYRCMLRPTRMISALRHKSKFKFELKKKQVKTQFRIFFSQIFMIPCCSILEDLSIDVSIANVGLILTKLR